MLCNLAPIVLFAYNRPKHTKITLDALKNNILAKESELYIFLDSPTKFQKSHQILKRYLKFFATRSHDFKHIQLNIRPYNYGLSRNIIEGMNEIFTHYEKAIILEDDIFTSPAFLSYMNTSLVKYEHQLKVWSINGWVLPINYKKFGESFFSREINCWGWATWRNRWKYYKKDPEYFLKCFTKEEKNAFNLDDTIDYFSQINLNAKGKIDTWFIFNYAVAFKRGALALCPSISYVRNIGFDNSGVHCGDDQEAFFSTTLLNNQINISYPQSICEDPKIIELTKQAYREFYNTYSKSLTKRIQHKFKKLRAFNILVNLIQNSRLLCKNPLSRYIKNALKILFVDNETKFGENVTFSNCTFGKFTHIYSNTILCNTHIGDFSYVSNNTHITNATIGKFCSIASNCQIGLGLHPSRHFVSTHPVFYSTQKQIDLRFVQNNQFCEYANVRIGNDVWIGSNVIIKDGVSIQDGVIVGAGSVVTKDLQAYGIYGGVPAKLIRFRFTQVQIQMLQELQWWDLPLNDLRQYAPYFQNIDSLESFLKNIFKAS